jgi:hypothetical protein
LVDAGKDVGQVAIDIHTYVEYRAEAFTTRSERPILCRRLGILFSMPRS